MLEEYKNIRTTLTLPDRLNKRSQHFVEGGIFPNRNALIITALENFLIELERKEIDRQFEAMADDNTYQAMNEQISKSFSESDWEALVEGENE